MDGMWRAGLVARALQLHLLASAQVVGAHRAFDAVRARADRLVRLVARTAFIVLSL